MIKKQIRSIVTLLLIVALLIPFFPTTAQAAHENTYSNTGNMRNDIIGVALTQVGYTEGSNNYTKYGVWYGLPNSPWCGMFVSWCASQAGIPTSVLQRTGIANPSNFGLSYQDGQNYTPQKGDLFFKKSFSHVGLVYYTEGEYFYTIEGNTSTTSYDGTSVMIRKRKISEFYFSSPNYSGSSSAPSECNHDYETKVEAEHPHKEYRVCTKCSKKTNTGTEHFESDCKICVQNSCEHTFSQWKNVNDNNHSRVCSKCDYEQTTAHSWNPGKVIKEATCIAEGSQQITCSDCGIEIEKTIAPTNQHTYEDYSYINESEHQTVCDTCSNQITSEHNLSSTWSYDNLYHWTSCTDCGGRIRHAEHVFLNGCLESCETCGYIPENGHKTTGEMLSNEDSHWESCVRCHQEVNTHAHIYTSECDEICNDCGFQRSGTTPHQDITHADETGHWRQCEACMRVTEVQSHVASKNTKDWEDQLCVHCGFELRSADTHVHAFATVEHDSYTHWGSCECGEIMEPEVHCWDFQTGNCSVCGISHASSTDTNTSFFVILLQKIFG